MVEPVAKCLWSECRNLALPGNIEHRFHHIAESGRLAEKVGNLRSDRRQFCPAIDVSKSICAEWALVLFVVVRHELGLVSAHVYSDWTLAFAAFTAQA